MPKKYEVPVCTGCGGAFPIGCTCEETNAKTGKVVIAYDVRDVKPLVEAARLLNEAETVAGIVLAVNEVRKALKAFEESPATADQVRKEMGREAEG